MSTYNNGFKLRTRAMTVSNNRVIKLELCGIIRFMNVPMIIPTHRAIEITPQQVF